MIPAEQTPPDQIAMLKASRDGVARMVELLKLERAAVHQIGDADAKLIELQLQYPSSQCHEELMRQKLDGTRRLAAAKIEQITVQIASNSTQLKTIEELVRQMEAPLFDMAGGKLTPQ